MDAERASAGKPAAMDSQLPVHGAAAAAPAGKSRQPGQSQLAPDAATSSSVLPAPAAEAAKAAGAASGQGAFQDEAPAFAQLRRPAGWWRTACWAMCLPW